MACYIAFQDKDSSIQRALAWKISRSVLNFCFTNLRKSSSCTVCSSSLVENIQSGYASVPHIAAVGINTYDRCEQELTDLMMKYKTEWNEVGLWST